MIINQDEIEKGLWEVCINIPSITYDLLLNMPVTKRDMLIRTWNAKVQREKQK